MSSCSYLGEHFSAPLVSWVIWVLFTCSLMGLASIVVLLICKDWEGVSLKCSLEVFVMLLVPGLLSLILSFIIFPLFLFVLLLLFSLFMLVFHFLLFLIPVFSLASSFSSILFSLCPVVLDSLRMPPPPPPLPFSPVSPQVLSF